MKTLLLLCLVVAGLADAARSDAAGINLSWDDCGSFGTPNKTFACSTSVGAPFALVGSFVPPANVGDFLGISAEIAITVGEVLPDWWKLGAGKCRGKSSLTSTFDFAEDTRCVDFYAGQAQGGYDYETGYLAPNRARLRVECALPYDNRGALDPATEYYAFRMLITPSHTTGDSACSGCREPACLVLGHLQLFQPAEIGNDPILEVPATRNWVTWQADSIPNCPAAAGPRTTRWGGTKTLYR